MLRSSAITQGIQRSPNRAMLRAVGFDDDDFNKPIIGIANGFSTITPCNIGLNDLALKAEQTIRKEGGMPQIFGTITVSDGNTEINQTISVIVTQRADVWVQSIDILDRNTGTASITEGNDIAIDVFVRNSGNSIAQPVTVRCSVNGQTIGTPQIGMISPGGLESTTCEEWNRLDIQSGNVTLQIEIDWTDDLDETNELNNIWSTVVTVQDRGGETTDASGGQDNSSTLGEYNSLLWVGVVVLGLLALLVFMYGPNQIRKIE